MRPERERPRVLTRFGDDHCEVVLDRPERHNAVDTRMRDELVAALRALAAAPDAPAVVLRGNGPSFCSGGDLDEFGAGEPVGNYLARARRSLPAIVAGISDRLVGAVHGACIGAGLELAAFARTLYCSPDARFRLPELHMGLVPGMGGTRSLPARIGRDRTLWLLLTGETIDSRTALEWNLVDEVVPREVLLERARSAAATGRHARQAAIR